MWFDVECGLYKQGCLISPILFDLHSYLNTLDIGINVSGETLYSLLYKMT